jgi:curved DNA-binding protein CbpA
MSNDFDPKKIIDFSKDYYSILGIDKSDLPNGNSRSIKLQCSEIIEKCFRKMARKCHPDFGGSKESFLDLVRARRILEDFYLRKIYDQGYFEEFTISTDIRQFEVDWSKIGNYRKGSPEDTTGFNLFFKICEFKNELNLIPAFYPKSEEHNYEWDWILENTNSKLALSIVNDENEVLRLTSSDQIDKSLPFKIYICIPRSSLNLIRKTETILDPFGKTLVNGSINSVNYNDFNLLETTNLEDAISYIVNELSKDISDFRDGKLQTSNKADLNWMNTKEINNFDKSQLEKILNMRSFEVANDEKAGDFLDDIKEDENENETASNKPTLPL